MQINNPTANIKRNADTSQFSTKIGSIVYEVSVNFSTSAKETMDKKLIRLIKNEAEAVS